MGRASPRCVSFLEPITPLTPQPTHLPTNSGYGSGCLVSVAHQLAEYLIRYSFGISGGIGMRGIPHLTYSPCWVVFIVS